MTKWQDMGGRTQHTPETLKRVAESAEALKRLLEQQVAAKEAEILALQQKLALLQSSRDDQ